MRRQAQIGRDRGVALREFLPDQFGILQRRHDHHIVAGLPVTRRRDAVVLGQLQRVDDAQDLVEVAPGRGRVGDREPDLLRRVAWTPPEPATVEAIGSALSELGARPWQVAATSQLIAKAFVDATQSPNEQPEPQS